jgi:hypothetical protein
LPPTEATHQLVRRCRPMTLRRFLNMVTKMEEGGLRGREEN